MPPYKLLIIEDSHVCAAILGRVVQKGGGWDVVGWVQDADGAVEFLATARPDVVTLDLGIPGGGGLELLSRMRDQSGIPIVVVSASTFEGSPAVAEALSRGAESCFDKAKILSNAPELMKVLKAAIGIA